MKCESVKATKIVPSFKKVVCECTVPLNKSLNARNCYSKMIGLTILWIKRILFLSTYFSYTD